MTPFYWLLSEVAKLDLNAQHHLVVRGFFTAFQYSQTQGE